MNRGGSLQTRSLRSSAAAARAFCALSGQSRVTVGRHCCKYRHLPSPAHHPSPGSAVSSTSPVDGLEDHPRRGPSRWCGWGLKCSTRVVRARPASLQPLQPVCGRFLAVCCLLLCSPPPSLCHRNHSSELRPPYNLQCPTPGGPYIYSFMASRRSTTRGLVLRN